MLAHFELKDELCPCGCGQPSVLQLNDPKRPPNLDDVSVDQVVCKYRARLDYVERRNAERYKDKPEKLDGVLYLARPFDPEQDKGKPRGDADERTRVARPRRGRL